MLLIRFGVLAAPSRPFNAKSFTFWRWRGELSFNWLPRVATRQARAGAVWVAELVAQALSLAYRRGQGLAPFV